LKLGSFAFLVSPGLSFAQTPSFEIGAARPIYPLVFVASDNHSLSRPGFYNTKHGMDSHHPDEPDGNSAVWILHPASNQPVKIFPLPVHFQQGLIDADPSLGAATEVNATLDGDGVLVTWFHNLTQRRPANENTIRSTQGADIYKIDLRAAKQSANFNPNLLPVTRLTIQPSNVNQNALNPTYAARQNYAWSKPFHMHAIEMETELGLRVLYVSDKRHVQNSNWGNSQYNIFVASYGPDGRLVDDNQFQYYTTTSAISPTNLRDGFAFSYHANTDGDLKWEIQQINSAGRWSPLQGYGMRGRLGWHNGTLCVSSDPRGDIWFGTGYYPSNNNGAGGVWALEYAKAGKNTQFQNNNRGMPVNAGAFLYTQEVEWDEDDPSLASNGGFCDATKQQQGLCLGKFTTPRCGRPDDLYLSYSPTFANHRNLPTTWTTTAAPPLYDFHIVHRSNLWSATSPRTANAYPTVINETTGRFSLLWATPLISHSERFSEQPRFSRQVTPFAGHLPVAAVGASALYNTDIVPAECRLNRTYNPNTNEPGGITSVEKSNLYENITSLNYVRDSSSGNLDSVCDEPVLPANVFGVSINLTDNKTDWIKLNGISSRKEKVKQLCITKTAGQSPNNEDHSFKSIIPANHSFEMHLLHGRYGLKMADVRSWHSLKPGEVRTDCGGCHQHREDKQAVAFENKLANSPSYTPQDCVNKTSVIRYDDQCRPQLVELQTPAEPVPLMGDNTFLFNGLRENCESCHRVGGSGAPAFIVHTVSADGRGPAQRTIEELKAKNYLRAYDGALGSPAFWAARGERTDGRSNSNYPSGSRFRYSDVHSNLNLCANLDNWVYLFGHWIDNHMPGEWAFSTQFFNQTTQSYDVDTFHPTVSFGLHDTVSCNPAGGIKIGTWDDSGLVSEIKVKRNSQEVLTLTDQPNGSHSATNIQLTANTDLLEVTVIDGADNRQTYAARLEQLLHECLNPNSNAGAFGGFGQSGGTSTPTPTPTPTATPTPPVRPTQNPPDYSSSLSLKGPKAGVLGGPIEFKVYGPAALIGKSAVIAASSKKTRIKNRFPFANRDLYLPFEPSDPAIIWSSQNLVGRFESEGDGAVARVVLNLPNDPQLMGQIYMVGVAIEGNTLYGRAKRIKRFTLRYDVSTLKLELDDLESEILSGSDRTRVIKFKKSRSLVKQLRRSTLSSERLVKRAQRRLNQLLEKIAELKV